jgi:metal-dependent amidase/aminoacylase/carboxypeptidase family protein
LTNASTRPADERINAAVGAACGVIGETAEFLHTHPERGHEEHASADHTARSLGAAGLGVQLGMATALLADLVGTHEGATVGLVRVYDAVPAHSDDGTLSTPHSHRRSAGVLPI